jgi:hypothetical protein
MAGVQKGVDDSAGLGLVARSVVAHAEVHGAQARLADFQP